jgi:hypothetical protein
MRVFIRTTGSESFQVTFDIKNDEEAIEFHDRVAIRACDGPHDFIGNIVKRIRHEEYIDRGFTI